MTKLHILLLYVLFATILGCTQSSSTNNSIPPATMSSSVNEGKYDYSHNITPKRKYIVIVAADYREYKSNDFPNIGSVGTDLAKEIALSDTAKISFEQGQQQTLELIKYFDDQAKEFQKFFDENPLAMLKNELINSGKFIVLDESIIKLKTNMKPRFIVSINLHKNGKNKSEEAKCYLNMIDMQTSQITASSKGSGLNLEESIKRASDILIKNLP